MERNSNLHKFFIRKGIILHEKGKEISAVLLSGDIIKTSVTLYHVILYEEIIIHYSVSDVIHLQHISSMFHKNSHFLGIKIIS